LTAHRTIMTTLAYKIAKRHVEGFASDVSQARGSRDDGGSREDNEARERYDCQAALQLGIDAYHWLIRADQAIRMAGEFDAEVAQAMEALLRQWQKPLPQINGWVDVQLRRGLTLDNLTQFRECESEVAAIVRSFDDPSLTDAMRQLRDQAIAEHRDGKTAEYV
jgi:hypothetical protein